jgi:type IV pilus assembly protein PilP
MKITALAMGLATICAFAVGCGNGEEVSKKLNEPAATPTQYRAATPPPVIMPPKMKQLEFSEADFTESDKSRDPFRSYALGFVQQAQKTTKSQVTVILGDYAIDELKLVGIITGGEARAMVVDPQGKGWVLKKGDFVGKPDIVHVGGTNGADYQLNWRVDRIRPDDLVFIREDPAQPGVAPTTRIIPLHPEGDKGQGKQG